MTKETLSGVLESEGGKSGAKGMAMPDSVELTVLIRASGEVISVGRVIRVELREKHVTLHTVKDERFFFVYEDVLGIKVTAVAAAKERATGFAR